MGGARRARAGASRRATAARSPRSTPRRCAALLDETDELEQELSRLQVYSYLRLSMAATDVEANDLATFSRDRVAEIENTLVFLGLEWIALDDERGRRSCSRRRRARAVRAQAARRARGEAVRPERAGGAGAERAPPDGLRLAGAARPARLDARGAVRRRRGRAAAHDQPAALVSLPPRPRPSALARGDGALRRARAARRRARRLLRRARRRPAQHRPPARLREPDAADEPRQRARRRDRRGDDDRDGGGVSDRAQVVRGEGAPARPRQARARRPVRADRRGARCSPGRRPSRSSTRRSAASRRGSPRSSARASTPATSTCCRATARPAARTARRSRRRSCRTS